VGKIAPSQKRRERSSRFPFGRAIALATRRTRASRHNIYIHTMTHFNRRIQISPKIRQLQKNGWDKKCRGQWGSFICANDFDLQVDFQDYLKVKVIFLNGYFLHRIRKEWEILRLKWYFTIWYCEFKKIKSRLNV